MQTKAETVVCKKSTKKVFRIWLIYPISCSFGIWLVFFTKSADSLEGKIGVAFFVLVPVLMLLILYFWKFRHYLCKIVCNDRSVRRMSFFGKQLNEIEYGNIIKQEKILLFDVWYYYVATVNIDDSAEPWEIFNMSIRTDDVIIFEYVEDVVAFIQNRT